MKGTIAVSLTSRLLSAVAEVAESAGFGVEDWGDMIKVCEVGGRICTFFDGAEPDDDWKDGLRPVAGGEVPDLSQAFTCSVECRWEGLFCEILDLVSAHVEPLWVVDGDGILWSAADLDPDRIRL